VGLCTKWCCEIRKKTAGNITELSDRTPYEATLGDTPDNIRKTVIIVRAMYGLKSSGATWHAKFSETLRDIAYLHMRIRMFGINPL
jgi:hypothetical protein